MAERFVTESMCVLCACLRAYCFEGRVTYRRTLARSRLALRELYVAHTLRHIINVILNIITFYYFQQRLPPLTVHRAAANEGYSYCGYL